VFNSHQDVNGQTSGFVSSINQPTRHESGSYVQISNSIQLTVCIFKFSRGQFHERFTPHVMKTKFSIIDNSVTVGPSSIQSLICDHDTFHVTCIYDFGRDKEKELVAANSDAGSFHFSLCKDKEQAVKWFVIKSFQFSARDGTTSASTKVVKFFLWSVVQVLVKKSFDNINSFDIKVFTDECFENSLSSIRARIKIKSIEFLEV
jgi:hypothetical protein